jgi:endonuclease III
VTSNTDFRAILEAMLDRVEGGPLPAVTDVAERTEDPVRVLFTTMISLRTKDEVTAEAAEILFREAPTVEALAQMPEERIADLIYPAGFYRTKAKSIRGAAEIILRDHGGRVPTSLEELTALPGVGRKTANLVLGLSFGTPAICVDTHVHRIANRLGWVETKTPEQTEQALAELLPRELWIPVNGVFVAYGKQVCTPVSPFCSACLLDAVCPRQGVSRTR